MQWNVQSHQEIFTTQENNHLELFLLFEIFHFLLGVGHDRVGARLPASGADLAVLVCVLEGLDQAERLVH